jgi:peptidylprolyl isomerase
MVEHGNYVQIQYTGTYDNGEIFDTNVGFEPLEFLVGSAAIINGLDKGVLGMKENEIKDITVMPEEGYGEHSEEFVITVPKQDMNADFEPEIGMMLSIQMENENVVPARIAEIRGSDVILDLNHPLAGKTLHFNIKVIAINNEPQLNQGCSSCNGGSCGAGDCSGN